MKYTVKGIKERFLNGCGAIVDVNINKNYDGTPRELIRFIPP